MVKTTHALMPSLLMLDTNCNMTILEPRATSWPGETNVENLSFSGAPWKNQFILDRQTTQRPPSYF